MKQVDAQIQRLQAERATVNAEIAQLRARGLAEEHPEMAQLRARLEQTDQEMEKLTVLRRDLEVAGAGRRASMRGGGSRPAPPVMGGERGGAPGMAAGAIGGVQLDLINLANTMVDAAGAVRLAKLKLADTKRW
jgi:hypothetical protein